MKSALIKFKNISWLEKSEGLRYKEFVDGDRKLRLVEFSKGFVEEDWCTKEHIGYVIEGQFKINFNGNEVDYSKGDGIWIKGSEVNKHKLVIENDDKALLILFEKN